VTISYTTEGFVRRAVGTALDSYRGRIVCSGCLVRMALEHLQTGWRRSEVERAMEKVFEIPGALNHVSNGPCARCNRAMPCLGSPSR
jgi:hypothetical protein